MSPEQARGAELDGRSDLFSCGVVFFEMTTGALPFTGQTPMAIFESVLTRTPLPPSTVNPSVPAEFDRIVSKALEKDRDIRYQTAADLRGDLKRLKRSGDSGQPAIVSHQSSVVSQQSSAGGRQSRGLPWKPIAAAVAAIAVAIAGAFLWAGRTRAFSERDSVVIADFTNTTGEAVFDDTLKEALEVQLRQSPFLSVLP
jgi:serine/threonine protein kinase